MDGDSLRGAGHDLRKQGRPNQVLHVEDVTKAKLIGNFSTLLPDELTLGAEFRRFANDIPLGDAIADENC